MGAHVCERIDIANRSVFVIMHPVARRCALTLCRCTLKDYGEEPCVVDAASWPTLSVHPFAASKLSRRDASMRQWS
jgi:hypothetical protein